MPGPRGLLVLVAEIGVDVHDPGSTLEAIDEMSEGAPAPVEELPVDPLPLPDPDEPPPNGEEPPLPVDPEPFGTNEPGFEALWLDQTRCPTPAPARMATTRISATATTAKLLRVEAPVVGVLGP